MPDAAPIREVRAGAYRIPTETPEADGTFACDSTTLVVAEVEAGGQQGLGYTYTDASAGRLITGLLEHAIVGLDAFETGAAWAAMLHAVRNIGRAGLAATAISAVDAALWDWKGRMLGAAVARLLGTARHAVPIYGSGGFTSYSERQLAAQLGGWAQAGLRWVKMKIGSDPDRDLERVRAARRAIGEGTGLFVDANGAYSRKEALAFADAFAEVGVLWFEEPVSSDDLEGLRLVRDRAPAPIEVAAGEYGYEAMYFRRMLETGAVDVVQADASRCLGITGFLQAASLCEAFGAPLSAHCAPALHLHVACAAPRLRHIEWFFDHQRIEAMLFDGAPRTVEGAISPDLSRPGLGLELKRRDAERYAV
jgi:L-alanine-DL-glutamate epimerase-like enolase superfamily enzyme